MYLGVLFAPSQTSGANFDGLSPPNPILGGAGLGTASLSSPATLIGRGRMFAELDSSAALVTSLNAGALPPAVEAGFKDPNALSAGRTLQQVTAGPGWEIVARAQQYVIELHQYGGPSNLSVRRHDRTPTLP